MDNIKAEVKGHILTLTVDLSKRIGESKTGKSQIIATTGGNQKIEGGDGAVYGLNVYKKI